MTTVELDSLWANQEFQQLLEAAEQSGSVRHAELAEVLEPHELGLLETDAVYRELDQRGIEVIDETKEAAPPPPPPPPAVAQETTTDALQLFLREAGRHPLLNAAQEVELAKRSARSRSSTGAAATSSRPTRPGGSGRPSPGRWPTRRGRSGCPCTSSSGCRS